MKKGRFCVTTGDTIFSEEDCLKYINAFESDDASDGVMAVTPYIEDEKPLYVEVDASMKILSFRDDVYDGAKYISGGIYALNDKSFTVLENCINNGISRMRNFQRALIELNLNLKAYAIAKII